MKHIEFM